MKTESLYTSLRACGRAVLLGLCCASPSDARVVPADATDRTPIQLIVAVTDSRGSAIEKRSNLKPASATVIGNEVRVTVYGNPCEGGCGVSLSGLYSFDLGTPPSGAYTVKLTHYYDDGVRTLPYETLWFSDQLFTIQSSEPSASVPVPLSPLVNIILSMLMGALVLRYTRR